MKNCTRYEKTFFKGALGPVDICSVWSSITCLATLPLLCEVGRLEETDAEVPFGTNSASHRVSKYLVQLRKLLHNGPRGLHPFSE